MIDLPSERAKARIELLLATAESRTLDFKRLGKGKNARMQEAVCAFANTDGGIIAIGIEEGDTLIDVKLTRGSTGESDPGDDVVLITKDGMSIRFHETDVRSMGRAAGRA